MQGNIRLGNKRAGSPLKPEEGDVIIHIDRPNVLANYDLPESSMLIHVAESVECYRKKLFEDMVTGGPLSKEIVQLIRHLQEGRNVILMCWCAPKACHGDAIIERVLSCLNHSGGAPDWLVECMRRNRERPPPTLEEVETQFLASERIRRNYGKHRVKK